MPLAGTEGEVRLGQVLAGPGDEVDVPVEVTSSRDVMALQLIVEYDPSSFTPTELRLDGFYEDRRCGPMALTTRPELGVFTIAIFAGFSADGDCWLPAGEDHLVAHVSGKVSPAAAPNTIITLALTDGADDQGVGPWHLRNELSHFGIPLHPRLEPGEIRVLDPEFLRGDANDDGSLDISDAMSTLSRLFLGGRTPACADAADANDDGELDISEPVAHLAYLFESTEPPALALGVCARDAGRDALPLCRDSHCADP